MPQETDKPMFGGILHKLIIGAILIVASGVIAVIFVKTTFEEILIKTENLSQPNSKLYALNAFYKDVAQMDHTQQTEMLMDPALTSANFQKDSDTLILLLDSVQNLDWNEEQMDRLEDIRSIILGRNALLKKYLDARATQRTNPAFSRSLDTLTALLNAQSLLIDSSVVTTEEIKRVFQTPPSNSEDEAEDSEKGFFEKLFGRSKNKEQTEQTTKPQVVEETKVKIDTLSVSKRDTLLKEAELLIKQAESEQRYANYIAQRAELQLLEANSNLLNEVLVILQQVEQEELQRISSGNLEVGNLVNSSIEKIYLLFISIFIIAAVLGVLVLTDIANARFYRKKLTAERDRAEELSLVKERFLANMSHELRTPLQSILGYSEQLYGQNPENEEVKVIHNASEHLLHIVNEVLDYSRISSGKMTFENKPIVLSEVVSDVIRNMKVQVKDKKIRILEEDHLLDLKVYTDPFRIKQILFNLLGNAVKFTGEGFVKLSSRVKEETAEHYLVQFVVEDTGIGMNGEEIEKVFGDFEQANADISRNFGGTGLGLSIVKTLVNAYEGEIKIDSEKGTGTKITVFLNVLKHGAVEEEDSSVIEDTTNTFHRRFTNVLIVDDDSAILSLSSSILQKHGINCSITNSPKDALELSGNKKFDLAFLDIRMPEMPGTELCQKLKEILPDITCVAFTAHVMNTEKEAILQTGFDSLLTKPFREADLLRTIGYNINTAAMDETNNTAGKGDYESLKASLQKITSGDQQLITRIVNQFTTDTDLDVGNIKLSVQNKDLSKLREAVHRISGRMGMFEARKLASQLKSTEVAIVEQEPSEPIFAKIPDLILEIEKLNAKLKTEMLKS